VVSRTPDGKEVTLIQTIQHLGLEVADFTVDALDVRVCFELLGKQVAPSNPLFGGLWW
jgi:hypothetical protein